MAFWSSQRIEAEQKRRPLIDGENYNRGRIQQGAYELSLSRDALITPDRESFLHKAINHLKEAYAPANDQKADRMPSGSTLTIPPGQFALVYTKERVSIPPNAISFISVKAKVKLKGLVNISGFHVDPGYSGRLKFSLYNAGNRAICLTYGEPYFLIWFADLDEATIDPYDKNHFHNGQNGVTADDREQMSEGSHSPAALDQRLGQLEQRMNLFMAFTTAVMVAVFIPILIGVITMMMERWFNGPKVVDQPISSQIQSNTPPARTPP